MTLIKPYYDILYNFILYSLDVESFDYSANRRLAYLYVFNINHCDIYDRSEMYYLRKIL